MSNGKEKVRILCIFSNLLGNKRLSRRLEKTLNQIDTVSPVFLTIESKDYKKFSAPRLFRFSDTLESFFVAKNKFGKIDFPKYSMLFFQGYELTLCFLKYIKKIPTACMMDTTPALAQKLIVKSELSIIKIIQSFLASKINFLLFRQIFKHIKLFLPWSKWCADSLKNDYGIDEKDIETIRPSIDLSLWCPREHKNDKLTLLFIGNDFIRKGGKFLLNLYDKHLSDKYNLRIVSNDPYFKGKDFTPGIEIISGLSHKDKERLISIYQASDVLTLPTRRDQLPNVLTEAASVGLPIIATDVGAIGETVRDNVNGYLMPYDSTVKDWFDKITYLNEHRDILKKLGENSRKLAEEDSSAGKFEQIIREAINRLTNEDKKSEQSRFLRT